MHTGPSRTRPDARHLADDGRPAPASKRPIAPPKHRAPTAGHRFHHEPLLVRRSRRSPVVAAPVRADDVVPVDLEAAGEVAPVARVQRSRLAFALAITLAALPVLVVDNLSATAEPSHDEGRVDVASSAGESTTWAPSTAVTTAAPTTTSTTLAPTATTEAPTTSEAPATSETYQVQAVQAPVVTNPPTTAPPPAPPATTAPTYGDPSDPATWERMAQCESGGNWSMNTGNGYYGGLQFSLATWRNVGGAGYPHQASKAEQIKRGQVLQAQAGWGQWPHCARQLGYL
jgi:hypothetical protein